MSVKKQTKKPVKKPGERKTVEKVTQIAQLLKSVVELIRTLLEMW